MIIKIGDKVFDTANCGEPVGISLRKDELWNLQQIMQHEENDTLFVFPPFWQAEQKDKWKKEMPEPSYGGGQDEERAKKAIGGALNVLRKEKEARERGESTFPEIEQ